MRVVLLVFMGYFAILPVFGNFCTSVYTDNIEHLCADTYWTVDDIDETSVAPGNKCWCRRNAGNGDVGPWVLFRVYNNRNVDECNSACARACSRKEDWANGCYSVMYSAMLLLNK